MWAGLLRLIQSTIAASVVLLPEPVGPVTSTKPLGRFAKVFSTSGSCKSSRLRMVCGISRSTIAGPRRLSIRLMRTRTRSKANEPSKSCSLRNCSRSAELNTSLSQRSNCTASVVGQSLLMISPRSRKRGCSPTPR